VWVVVVGEVVANKTENSINMTLDFLLKTVTPSIMALAQTSNFPSK
jgi:hypothetical protein